MPPKIEGSWPDSKPMSAKRMRVELFEKAKEEAAAAAPAILDGLRAQYDFNNVKDVERFITDTHYEIATANRSENPECLVLTAAKTKHIDAMEKRIVRLGQNYDDLIKELEGRVLEMTEAVRAFKTENAALRDENDKLKRRLKGEDVRD
jgi:hypothetical protein